MTENRKPVLKGPVQFGEYRLDPALRELKRGDEDIALQPRVFDLLVYLAGNPDRAVDKDELQDAVWPGMYITETALTRAIMKARKAVGDNASSQSVIKTVHGHGYRFIAPLGEVQGEAAVAPMSPAPPGRLTFVSSRGRMAMLGVAAMLVVLTWQLVRAPHAELSEVRLAVLPLVVETGNEDHSWAQTGLMGYIAGLLGDGGLVAVVDAPRVLELAGNGALHREPNAEQDRRLKVLESDLDASHVLAMTLSGSGSSFRMDYALLDYSGQVREGTMVGENITQLARGVVQATYAELGGDAGQEALEGLVSMDPFVNEAIARGMGLRLLGGCGQAIPLFRMARLQESRLYRPAYELAECLLQEGESADAELVLSELLYVLEQFPPAMPYTRTVNRLAGLFLDRGDLENARATLERLGQPDPVLETSMLQARLEFLSGNREAAVNILSRAKNTARGWSTREQALLDSLQAEPGELQ